MTTFSAAVALDALSGFSWERVFPPERCGLPIELEIGIGKGAFVLRRALAHPERNFLGIEWANEFYRYAVDRMQRRGAQNVRLLRCDAGWFVRQACPAGSLAALHVYHPDPWPKKRHHKRRLFQPAFVAAATACLQHGARWAVQTDHAEYFAQIAALLRAQPGLEEVAFDDPAWGVSDAQIQTNFEIKYLREGRTMHRIAMRRV